MQSALRATKGVSKVTVSMDTGEAKVTYNPKQTNLKRVVAAVDNARGMAQYSAKIKKG